MNLIDRYLQEVGRHLPRKKRQDILVELRSSLVDTLEDRVGGEPSEEEISQVLKEFGPPKEVAARYHPEGQYLIGPADYALFRLGVVIALAAARGGELLGWSGAVFLAGDPVQPLEVLAGLINTVPITFGWVVLVFLVLQRFDVQAELDDQPWDPGTLPQLEKGEEVKRGDLIAGLVFSILILVFVAFFPQWIGFIDTVEGTFYTNPVIQRYLGWIIASLLVGAALDVYLLWKGRWQLGTRIAKIAVNLFSIAVLGLLYQGHTEWLSQRDMGGFLMVIEQIPQMVEQGWEVLGMAAFQLAFLVVLIITGVETLILMYRLISSQLEKGYPGEKLSLNG